jgi:hypothetical protein
VEANISIQIGVKVIIFKSSITVWFSVHLSESKGCYRGKNRANPLLYPAISSTIGLI